VSSFGDIFSAMRQVILTQSRLDQLDLRMTRMADDIDGLADGISSLRDRISRLEGMIEGAAMAAGRQQRRIEE
jgi:predicted  nucleic acid-binding Zn-ribbon protein